MPIHFLKMISRHPRSVIIVSLVAAVVSVLYAATHLRFKTNRLDLVSSKDRYSLLHREYSKEFESRDRIVIVIQSDHPERAKAFAGSLGSRLEADRGNFEKVFYRIDVEPLKNKGLLYLSADDLLALRKKLQTHEELIKDLAASPTLLHLFSLINREITSAMISHTFTGFLLEEEGGAEQEPVDLSLLISILKEMNERVAGHQPYVSPWEVFFTKEKWKASEDGFLWSDDKTFLFLLVTPRQASGTFDRFRKAVERVRREVAELRKDYPGLEVGVTGQSVLDSDEMGAAQRDTAMAALISLVGVGLLYFVMFKGVVRPVFAIAALIIGLCWSIGFTALTVGHLNIITMTFAPLLIGLGIDYGSYFIARYKEERAPGGGGPGALERTTVGVGPGIAATALITAFSFFTLVLTDFKGLVELGFISGTGILLILLATFTVLPALLALYDGRGKEDADLRETRGDEAPSGYLEGLYRYPLVTLSAGVLLVLLSVAFLGGVGSDFNLLHMQAEGTESVVWELKILENAKRSTWFAVSMADSLEEVRRKEKAFKALPLVAEVQSIASLIPQNQEQKLRLIKGLRPLLAGISILKVEPGPLDLEALLSTLERIKFKMLEDSHEAWDTKKRPPIEEMQEVRRLIDQFLAWAKRMGPKEVRRALGGFEGELLGDLRDKFDILKRNLDAGPMTIQDVPPELLERFVGRTGRYQVLIFPAENIWEPEQLARFVQEIRTVDPDAIGDPVLGFEHMRAMREAYKKAGLYSLVGLFLLVFLTFKEVQSSLLALIPLALGSLWTLGFMGAAEVKFNLANLIVLPLIGAPGIEGGIMVLSRYREERATRKFPIPLPKSTGRAMAFSALSTMVGFGSLMISRHRGIHSIGLLLMVGVGCILLASVTVLPAILRIRLLRQAKVSAANGGMHQTVDAKEGGWKDGTS